MLSFLKKKDVDEDEGKAVGATKPMFAAHAPFEEFIPYFCHYNPYTLLTKNGELAQIIKISSNNLGLNYESAGGGEHSVREYVRHAIQQAVSTRNYAFWIHTLRKRKPISIDSSYSNPFAAYVYERWQKMNRWKYEYYNEIYLTVLHEGQFCELLDKRTLKNAWLPKANRNYRNDYLDKASVELDGAVASILQTIRKNYNAQRLSVAERHDTAAQGDDHNKPVFFSEPTEFLGEIINLHSQPFPVKKIDISKQLCNHQLTFGFNAFEAKSEAGTRRFGAILTAKHYHEVTPETADHLLQCPIELVVSQSFNFISSKQALKQYKEQKVMFEISDDATSAKVSGLDEMLKTHQNRPTDFSAQQTSIMIVVDEYRQLEEDVQKVQQSFADMGLIAVREDINLEECFWAQMPGNFEFIRRKSPIATGKVAGFSRLNLFPGGYSKNNHWGTAATIIPTTVKTPYFFNFHHRDNGHTMVFDFNSFHDQAGYTLLNFLLTSTLKYDARLYVFDHNRSAQLWFDKLDGNYHIFPVGAARKTPHALRLNPFALEVTPRNQSFLLAWCMTLFTPGFEPTDAQRETLQRAIAQVYESPADNRYLDNFIRIVAAADAELAAAFASFHGSGEFASLFDTASESIDLKAAFHAFDMDPVVKHSACTVPVFAYLMHRIITELDGKPAVIVLHDAFDLLENRFFAPRLESLMEMLQQNNVMLICTTRRPDSVTSKSSFATFMQHAATKIYIPDDVDINYMAMAPGLTIHDARMLLRMARQKGDFLLKQSSESVGLRVNLETLEDVKSVFAHDIKTLIAAGGKFASLPKALG